MAINLKEMNRPLDITARNGEKKNHFLLLMVLLDAVLLTMTALFYQGLFEDIRPPDSK